jgi:CheY-like chemotaxis protein
MTANKSILIIEDDLAIQQMMRDVLELEGYQVATATDGSVGIAKLKTLPARPSVILLDMMMPGMNGWEFLDFQRNDSRFAAIPVIVCSAYAESAKSVKPAAVIEKPVQLKTLMNAVKAFCD